MKYSIKDFTPLIVIFLVILAFTFASQWITGSWNTMNAMNSFMGAFFIVFGTFKVINLHGFVEAYSTYDVIAKQSRAYAYAYPFIELGLGVAYLFRLFPVATNLITLVLMLVSSIGVAIELSKGKEIVCACLGVVFKLPMTYVTLLEDLLMAGMAAYMLFQLR